MGLHPGTLPMVMGSLPGIPARSDGSPPWHPCPLLFNIQKRDRCLSLQEGAACCRGTGRHTHTTCTRGSPFYRSYSELKPNSFYGPVLVTGSCLQHIAHPADAGTLVLNAPKTRAVLTGAAPPGLNQPGLSQPCRSWKTQPCCSSSCASKAGEMGTKG